MGHNLRYRTGWLSKKIHVLSIQEQRDIDAVEVNRPPDHDDTVQRAKINGRADLLAPVLVTVTDRDS